MNKNNIKELNQINIERANSNSFYNRGTNTEKLYKKYAEEIKSWSISDKKKEQLNEKEIIFTNEDYEVFTEDDRVFIDFKLKPKRQLIVALKSRGYWWNAHKSAWSTYIKKLDKEWICSLSKNYEKYI